MSIVLTSYLITRLSGATLARNAQNKNSPRTLNERQIMNNKLPNKLIYANRFAKKAATTFEVGKIYARNKSGEFNKEVSGDFEVISQEKAVTDLSSWNALRLNENGKVDFIAINVRSKTSQEFLTELFN